MDILEARIRKIISNPSFKENIQTVDDLREYVKGYADTGIAEAKKLVRPKFLRSKVDWEKGRKLYIKCVVLPVDEIGEEIVKEYEVARLANDISREEFSRKVPEIIKDVYGSLENYGAYFQKMADLIQQQSEVIDATKTNRTETVFLKTPIKLMLSKQKKNFHDLAAACVEYS